MNERKKIYALYLDNKTYMIKIKNKTRIFGDIVRMFNLLTEDEQICKRNSCLYLSFSQKALKEKAKEARKQYIAELQAKIERLEAMKL